MVLVIICRNNCWRIDLFILPEQQKEDEECESRMGIISSMKSPPTRLIYDDFFFFPKIRIKISDQITTQILTQTKADITLGRGQGAQDAAIPEALTTGAALVLILAAGSSRDQVDWRNIGISSFLHHHFF
jgi:hypothetical protein